MFAAQAPTRKPTLAARQITSQYLNLEGTLERKVK
jgi:hypothetical protein